MRIRNVTPNTVYVEDIDLHIHPQEVTDISVDTLRRSRGIRNFICSKQCEIVSYDEGERIESALAYLRSQRSTAHEGSDHYDPSYRPEPASGLEVRYRGMVYDTSGYAKVNRNLVLGLCNAGVTVKLSPMRGFNQLPEEDLRQIAHLERTPISRWHILIDSVIPSFANMRTGGYQILYSTIESYTVPEQFIQCCKLYDEIWLTSEWSADVLSKYVTDRPIHVVVPGVDPELYREEGPRFTLPGAKRFVFLSVFNWNYRKGYDVLLRAYLRAFSGDDDVTLLLATRYQTGRTRHHRQKVKEGVDAIIKEFGGPRPAHILRYCDIIRESQMPCLYRAADCFVLCTRGEGIGLPPMEASMCGLPVIITKCSGQQTYVRDDNCYAIPIDRLEVLGRNKTNMHYWDGQMFPALTDESVIDAFASAMREVVSHYDQAKAKNKRLQEMIRSRLTWEHTTRRALELLNKAWTRVLERREAKK